MSAILTQEIDSIKVATTNGTYTIRGVHHKNDLILQGLPILRLPNGISIGGSLNLTYCDKLESLPENLEVSGSAYLSQSALRQLPKGFKVGGNLFMMGTGITSLPSDLVVGGNIIAGDILKSNEYWNVSKPLGPLGIHAVYNSVLDKVSYRSFNGNLKAFEAYIKANDKLDTLEKCFAINPAENRNMAQYIDFINECKAAA